MPLNRDAVRDAMPTFFDLLESGRRGVSYSIDGIHLGRWASSIFWAGVTWPDTWTREISPRAGCSDTTTLMTNNVHQRVPQNRQLLLGTISFTVCFAAWGLISAFAPRFRQLLHGSICFCTSRRFTDTKFWLWPV